jgi:hypothetical protein
MELFLQQHSNIQEEMDTLFSICIFKKSYIELVSYFENQLTKLQKINHQKKRIILNERLYDFINYLKQCDPTKIVNSIFFINQNMYEYHLTNQDITIAEEYNLHNPYYKNDTIFHIEFFKNFFCNDKFYVIAYFDKKMTLHYYNPSKEKKIVQSIPQDIPNYLQSLKVMDIYVYGLKETKYKKLEKIPTRNEFFEMMEKEKMLENHQLLQKRLDELLINPDLYVFGKLKKEILEAIECYQLKELYIEQKKWIKLQEFCDPTLFNFKIYPILSLSKNDIGDRFIQEYNGLMGIKYF